MSLTSLLLSYLIVVESASTLSTLSVIEFSPPFSSFDVVSSSTLTSFIMPIFSKIAIKNPPVS